ncbi:MAG TPA: methyl-accepting chemotaxis protein [Myxococcaceae bacterium]|nr:methyl-accepting chemotaxis protein [Myxococcaceae bacterium]
MRRPLRDELPTPLSPRQAPVHRLIRGAIEERPQGRLWSLQTKIFVGYLILFGALGATFQYAPANPWWVGWGEAALVMLVVAIVLLSTLTKMTRVRELSRSALEISRGDLSKPVVARQAWPPDEIDELSKAIGHMQENLRELVGHIQRTAQSVSDSATELQHSAGGVNASTDEVAHSMRKIAGGAETQSQLVAQASQVITEMATSIQRTAGSAEDAARSTGETSQAAEEGARAARLAGEKVKKVFSRIETASHEVFAFGEKTQEISKIVEVITQVAQQTNLLALNATIEAARAGEYGRGFAVVADEVRKLAESAGRSAEQISRLARDIASQSSAVVSAMKEGIEELSEGREDLNTIVKSLSGITDTARKGAEKVHLISESAREQFKGSEEMVKAIQQISHVARENSGSTEAVQSTISEQESSVSRMTSAAQELANLAVELHNVVTRFRLG